MTRIFWCNGFSLYKKIKWSLTGICLSIQLDYVQFGNNIFFAKECQPNKQQINQPTTIYSLKILFSLPRNAKHPTNQPTNEQTQLTGDKKFQSGNSAIWNK